MRILAVDDDPVILDLLARSMRQSGFGDVVFAESAEEAEALIEDATHPFDTFLLDIMLPGTDGIEMCRRIRARTEYRATPIIMITASRAHDIMSRAFAAGATDFVTKPFDGLELGTRINLASMLNDSLRREQVNQHALEELTRFMSIAFDERFELREVPGAKPFLTLENDLLRREENALYAMSLLAIQIEDANTIFRNTKPSQFRQMIEIAGQAISRAVNLESTRFAYAGRGEFVAVVYSRERLDAVGLGHDVSDDMARAWDAAALGLEDAPEVTAVRIEDRRLWSGKSAASAIRNFQGSGRLHAAAEPDEVQNLFDQLSTKL